MQAAANGQWKDRFSRTEGLPEICPWGSGFQNSFFTVWIFAIHACLVVELLIPIIWVNWGSSSILFYSNHFLSTQSLSMNLCFGCCKLQGLKKMLKIPGRIPSRATAWKDLRAMARLLGRCRYHKLDSGMMAEPQITCSKAGTTPKAKTQRQSEMAQQTRLATRMPPVPIITRIAPCSPRRPAGTTSPM